MRKQLYAYLIALFLLCGCATKPYNPPAIRKMAPEISLIASQAKNTTNSAERTVEFAKIVDTKYKGDKDAYNTVKSAQETVIESQKTEAQLKSALQKSEKADAQVEKLESEYGEATEKIGKLSKENQTLKEKITALGKTIWSQRIWIIGLGVALVGAIAFVVKPWKWFI